MEITFYDRDGVPIAYLADDETIYLFRGQPVGYLLQNSVYSFLGRHLGWYDHGWICDHAGYCLLFTEAAQGGPARPVKRPKPNKLIKIFRPVKSAREAKPAKLSRSPSWSKLSWSQFFSDGL